jgi:hypothetical protein
MYTSTKLTFLNRPKHVGATRFPRNAQRTVLRFVFERGDSPISARLVRLHEREKAHSLSALRRALRPPGRPDYQKWSQLREP